MRMDSRRSHRQAPISRSVDQVFPNPSSSIRKEQSDHYERVPSQKRAPYFSKNSEKEDKSFYEQLRRQREQDENSDWEETPGSIKAPVVLEDEDIEFLDQLKKKKEESFRSLDEQVEKFKERRHNTVLLTAQEQVTRERDTDFGFSKSISVPSAGKRKFGRLPRYLKTKEKRAKVESAESCILPSLIPYSSNGSEEEEESHKSLGTPVDLEKSGSLNNLSDATGSQHSVTGYSFLAFAEKYLDMPSQRMDYYDGLPCSLSSSTCSPTTKNVPKTTDLGVSYVSSLFGSCVTNCECEEAEISEELLLQEQTSLGIENKHDYHKEEQSKSINYSRVSECDVDNEHDLYNHWNRQEDN